MATITYNDSRKFCPGCKQMRSARQYKAVGQRFCDRCISRGQDKLPESARTAGVNYEIKRSET